jgi:hypothetical protein
VIVDKAHEVVVYRGKRVIEYEKQQPQKEMLLVF